MGHAFSGLLGLAALGLAFAASAEPETAVDPVDVSQVSARPARSSEKASELPPGALQVDFQASRSLLASPPIDPTLERRPMQQLVTGKPSAEPAPALSSREQSRPGARITLEGADRCDPAAPERLRRAECARVIEARSAEFDRSPAPLSPEQRLLLEQRTGQSLPGAQNAARRLAGPGGTDASLDDQAIAAVALRQPLPAEKKDENPAALTQEQAAAIVGQLLNPRPPGN